MKNYLELVYSKNYFNFTKIFVLEQFKIMPNYSASGLNRGLSSDFWYLTRANYVKFTDERLMCTEKQVLVKRRRGIPVPHQLSFSFSPSLSLYIYIYICVCVCVCDQIRHVSTDDCIF